MYNVICGHGQNSEGCQPCLFEEAMKEQQEIEKAVEVREVELRQKEVDAVTLSDCQECDGPQRWYFGYGPTCDNFCDDKVAFTQLN